MENYVLNVTKGFISTRRGTKDDGKCEWKDVTRKKRNN